MAEQNGLLCPVRRGRSAAAAVLESRGKELPPLPSFLLRLPSLSAPARASDATDGPSEGTLKQ
jgi:hypothetical protein